MPFMGSQRQRTVAPLLDQNTRTRLGQFVTRQGVEAGLIVGDGHFSEWSGAVVVVVEVDVVVYACHRRSGEPKGI